MRHAYATISLIFRFPNRAFCFDLSKHGCQCSQSLKHHVCDFTTLLKPYRMLRGACNHLGIMPPLFWGLFKISLRTCSLCATNTPAPSHTNKQLTYDKGFCPCSNFHDVLLIGKGLAINAMMTQKQNKIFTTNGFLNESHLACSRFTLWPQLNAFM